MTSRCRYFVVSSLLSLGWAGLGGAVAGAADGCLRASGAPLVWAHSGEWEGDRLVVGDAGDGALHLLSTTTLTWQRLAYPGSGPLEFDKHAVLPGHGPGVVVSALSRYVELDEQLRPVRGGDFAELAPGTVHAAVGPGVMNSRGEVLSFGMLAGADGEPWAGLTRVRLPPRAALERLREITPDSQEAQFYTSVFAFAAALGERHFWLVMDNPPHVLAFDGNEARRLDVVPPEWHRLPRVSSGGPESLAAVFSGLAPQSFPLGLYAHGRELFLLHREAQPTGGPRWQLLAVDPDTPSRTRRLTLPSRSLWLTLIPGPKYWAILEQGPVFGPPAQQPTSNVLLVPSAWFSAPASPLTGAKAEGACARAAG